MNDNSTPQSTPSRKRGWLIAAALTAAVAATGLAGASMAADGPGMGMGMGGHHGHHGPVDAATAAKHIDKMVEHILSDGTPLQKARLSEIAKSAFADLQGSRAEFHAAHEKAHALLMQTAIDRVALEQLRVEQVARMDKVSKRILTAVEDAAEVLTPEQRVRFHEQLQKRMRH